MNGCSLRLALLALGGLVTSCAPLMPMGRGVATSGLTPEPTTVAILPEVSPWSRTQILFSSYLSQALMSKGYTVTERFQLAAVMSELGLDKSGAVDDSSAAGGTLASPSVIKEIGKVYGLRYLVFYGQWAEGETQIRVVNCETAEVACVLVMGRDPVVDEPHLVAELLAEAMVQAAKLKPKPARVYLEFGIQHGSVADVKRILGAEDVLYLAERDGAYLTIFTRKYPQPAQAR